MQEASASAVLGDFANVKFRHNGVESIFFKRGDRFMVRTDGPDGKLTDYEIAYTFGVYRDPKFAGAYVNLADALRQLDREDEGEKALRQALAVMPRDADLHHTLGLLLIRRGDKAAAYRELADAARLAPDHARYAYVYAIALNSESKRAEALAVLRAADQHHPNNLDILSALISINREAGDRQAALHYARQAAVLLPDNANLKRLVAELDTH